MVLALIRQMLADCFEANSRGQIFRDEGWQAISTSIIAEQLAKRGLQWARESFVMAACSVDYGYSGIVCSIACSSSLLEVCHPQ
ncbi:uncharacterized protein L969DRAFT_84838 [Mixia osmundae IAM 14324]|nr:uncharacterized protein L969DRAFT_84838 [Mixia osmundae IAM 14324]KEI41122.1 hypothetical protein L969DRAFT_84838 [Mixia osmundae IAM 14324]